jgi:hypothetical protein
VYRLQLADHAPLAGDASPVSIEGSSNGICEPSGDDRKYRCRECSHPKAKECPDRRSGSARTLGRGDGQYRSVELARSRLRRRHRNSKRERGRSDRTLACASIRIELPRRTLLDSRQQ